jgi:integrase
MTERRKFTKGTLEALKVPRNRVRYVYDTEVRGLRLAIHPSGRKTFGLLRKFHGRVITYPLGPFPHVTVWQARQEASKKIAAMARGENPRDQLRGATSLTLGEFFEERYLKEHARQNVPLTERQRHDLRLTFQRHLNAWRNRSLVEITRADVERLVQRVGQPQVEIIKVRVGKKIVERNRKRGGPVAANRLLALLSSIFSEARNWGALRSDPPTHGVKKFVEQPRRRLLERGEEFQHFWQALSKEPDADLRHYLVLRLLTGVRERNILAARWADIDLGQKTWQIGQTKNGDPLLVTLSPFVVENVFNQRKREGEWVFPGRNNGGHRLSVTKPWRQFRRRIGIADLQLRDLRRSFASRLAANGTPMDVIAQTLGHRPGSKITASVYALADEDTKRRAVDATVQGMLTEAK